MWEYMASPEGMKYSPLFPNHLNWVAREKMKETMNAKETIEKMLKWWAWSPALE